MLSSFCGQRLFQTLCVGIGLSLVLGCTLFLLCVALEEAPHSVCVGQGQPLASTVNLGRSFLSPPP